MNTNLKILLTFDVEEFDLPVEYKQSIDLKEQLSVGMNGLSAIRELLDKTNIQTTLFTTGVFAENFPAVIKELASRHEIASHTYSHSRFNQSDLAHSRKLLSEISGQAIYGLRMPRMKQVDPSLIASAGYTYNSSINPTWLPGKYNHTAISRQPFLQGDLLQFPTSVTPHLRIPLFWLAFKNMPYIMYRSLLMQCLKRDGYACLYFHPWEFIDLGGYKIPAYIKRGSDKTLLNKISRLINDLKTVAVFESMNGYLQGDRERLK